MLVFSLILGLLVRLTAADDNSNYFFYPPQSYPNQHFGSQDPVWLIGSTVLLRWTTDMDSYNITLWQQNPNKDEAGPAKWSPIYTKESGDEEIGVTGYNWTVQTYGLDATDQIPVGSPIFFLAGGDILNTPGAPGFVSYYLNFTNNPNDPGLHPQSSSTSASSSTATSQSQQSITTITSNSAAVSTVVVSPSTTSDSSDSSSTTDSTSGTRHSTTSAPQTTSTLPNGATVTNTVNNNVLNGTPVPTAQPSGSPGAQYNGLSLASKVAIGVACGLGIPIIALLAWLAFRREMRSRQTAATAAAPPAYSRGTYDAKNGQPIIAEAHGTPMMHEIGSDIRSELPG